MTDERGAATVAAALMVLALVALMWGGVAVASAVTARHRAQAAADLA
ncbi:pilus assembly protein TadE, partial [Mycolicibacterium vaccae]|nr:pilus assembly protein TadE [Mycolicibacterium vaccae]